MRGDRRVIGRELRAKLLQWTGLPTSVGFARTKTLAKLANHVAKTADRRRGAYPQAWAQVCDFGVLSQRELDDLMGATAVGEVWGVGKKISARLEAAGIRTVLDLVRADLATLRRQFSVVLEKTVLELRGTSCLDVDDAPAANQQIMCSRSLATPVTQRQALVDVASMYRSGFNYVKAGVMLVDLQPEGQEQGELDLFSGTPETETTAPQRSHLMGALDALNRRFGRGAVSVASAAPWNSQRPYGEA